MIELESEPFDTGCRTDDVIPEEALKALMELPAGESPDDPVAWQLLGHCFEQLGEEEQARTCYATAARQMVRDRYADSAAAPLPFAVYMEPPTPRDH